MMHNLLISVLKTASFSLLLCVSGIGNIDCESKSDYIWFEKFKNDLL
jgi:hypothetical protein